MRGPMVRPAEALWRIGCVPAEYLLETDEAGMVDLSSWIVVGDRPALPEFRVVRRAG